MSWFGARQVSSIGLDIGHASVKMLQLESSGGQLRVRAACKLAMGDLGDGAGGSYRNYNFVSEAVGDALRRGRFRGREVILGLSGSALESTRVRVPLSLSGDVSLVATRAREQLGFAGGEGGVGCMASGVVREGNERAEQYMVFGAADEVLHERLTMLEDMNLLCRGIDPVPCSLLRWCLGHGEVDADAVTMLVDVGRRLTTLVMARGGDLTWARQVLIGSDDLVELVAGKLCLEEEDAEALLMRRYNREEEGSAECIGQGREQVERVLGGIIRDKVEELAEEIRLCFGYHQEAFGGRLPGWLLMTGGGAYGMILRGLLASSVKMDVRVERCFEGVSLVGGKVGLDLSGLASEWAVALGLCYKGYKGGRR